MRTTAAIVLGLALSTAAYGADTAPSQQVLAEMGLSGMQIMSDDAASEVRGMGFTFDGFRLYKAAQRNYQKQVKQYHKLVGKWQRDVDKYLSGGGKHHGGKSHYVGKSNYGKMGHGGKRW